MRRQERFFVAVTGAQGVGKSTFCRELARRLHEIWPAGVQLLDDLGAIVKAMGVPLGSNATPETIFAVWTTHLEREHSVVGDLIILDRCVVDALAYTRVLDVSTPFQLRTLEKAGVLASGSLGLVIHLQLSPFFENRGGAHETADDRRNVARQIEAILTEWQLPCIDLDAHDDEAVDVALQVILERVDRG